LGAGRPVKVLIRHEPPPDAHAVITDQYRLSSRKARNGEPTEIRHTMEFLATRIESFPSNLAVTQFPRIHIVEGDGNVLKKAGLVAAAVVGLSMLAPSIASADTMDDCDLTGGADLTLGLALDAVLDGGAAVIADVTATVDATLDASVDAGLSLTGSLLANCGC
jgi:hypothetical protein